jgi:MerR family redox-sensitive transcriptional activator SoxR
MADLTISDVAQRFGLRPSAIRYYEQIGLLPPTWRKSGQRRYDNSVLHRLAVIQRARQMGFTLDEIRKLFFGFRPGATPSKRWKEMSRQKIDELAAVREHIDVMLKLLEGLGNCQCDALDECGKRMLAKGVPKIDPDPTLRMINSRGTGPK